MGERGLKGEWGRKGETEGGKGSLRSLRSAVLLFVDPGVWVSCVGASHRIARQGERERGRDRERERGEREREREREIACLSKALRCSHKVLTQCDFCPLL